MSTLQYLATPITLDSGAHQDLQGDAVGNLKTTQATKVTSRTDAPVEAFPPKTGVTNITPITTATTTILSATSTSGIAYLYVQGGTLGNVTVYDNGAASGTILVPTVTAFNGQTLLYMVPFYTGLTVVTAAATIITGYIIAD